MRRFLWIAMLVSNVIALLLAVVSAGAFLLLQSFAVPLGAMACAIGALALGGILSTCMLAKGQSDGREK